MFAGIRMAVIMLHGRSDVNAFKISSLCHLQLPCLELGANDRSAPVPPAPFFMLNR